MKVDDIRKVAILGAGLWGLALHCVSRKPASN